MTPAPSHLSMEVGEDSLLSAVDEAFHLVLETPPYRQSKDRKTDTGKGQTGGKLHTNQGTVTNYHREGFYTCMIVTAKVGVCTLYNECMTIS